MTACSCTLLQDSLLLFLLLTFKIPQTRLATAGLRAISFTGPINWNSVPLSLRHTSILPTCKSNPRIILVFEVLFSVVRFAGVGGYAGTENISVLTTGFCFLSPSSLLVVLSFYVHVCLTAFLSLLHMVTTHMP